MGTSWAASLAVVILAALTGSDGYTSAPVGRSVRAIPDSKMNSAEQFQFLEMQVAILNRERLLNAAKVQNLSRQLNETLQKLEASSGTEMPLNNTVQNLSGNRNDMLMTSEASSDTDMSLNDSLNVYYRNKDWEELKLNLERILDRTSEAYYQLETTSYDHGYPLWRIGSYCQESLAEVLMSGVQGPNISESDGDTMLHGAADGNCVDLINMMLDRGADIEARDNEGATPLVIACRYGLMRTVRLLKERGADVNAADNKGETGLHLAVQGNHLELVMYLVKAGANVDVRDQNGRTPLSLAKMRGRRGMPAYLIMLEEELPAHWLY